MPVPPRDPASAIPTVIDLVHGGKLNAMAPCMAPLGPHQSDKVQGVQVNLQKLLQVIRFHWNLRTPGSVPFFWVQPWLTSVGDRGRNHETTELFISPQQAAAQCWRETAGWESSPDGLLGSPYQVWLSPQYPLVVSSLFLGHHETQKDSHHQGARGLQMTWSLYFPSWFSNLKGGPMQWNPSYPLFPTELFYHPHPHPPFSVSA